VTKTDDIDGDLLEAIRKYERAERSRLVEAEARRDVYEAALRDIVQALNTDELMPDRWMRLCALVDRIAREALEEP
jgi:hypothetical protein